MPRLKATAVLVLLLAAPPLAGCIAEEATPEVVDDQDPTLGSITGLVTDEDLVPLARVEVGVRGSTRSFFSDDEGRFLVPNLAPGVYKVDAARLGYAPATKIVEIREAEAVEVEFRLVAIPPPAIAYSEVHPFTGFYECALGASVWVSPCSYPYTAAYITLNESGYNPSEYGLPEDIQQNDFRYNFWVDLNATEVVSEMEWTPNTAASQQMQLILSCDEYDPIADDCNPTYASVRGESPLRVAWPAEAIPQRPDWVMARAYLPFLHPQVAFNQPFDVWNTVFYNGPAPPDYTILEDA